MMMIHSYACHSSNALNTIEKCIAVVRNWMASNRLFINDSKTEFMIIGSRKQLAKISVDRVTVGDAIIKPVTYVRNRGVWFDQHVKMSDHIGKICSKAFCSLYNLRQIRKCLTDEACKTLVHALVTCHLDYCNALMLYVSQYQEQRLQRVLNAAARLICCLPKYYHISPVLYDLQWLPIKYRVIFKITLPVLKVLHGLAPSYLEDMILLCYFYQENESSQRKEPLMVTVLPDRPWQKMSTDLFELTGGKKIVVMDNYPRFIEILTLVKTRSQTVIQKLKSVFASKPCNG